MNTTKNNSSFIHQHKSLLSSNLLLRQTVKARLETMSVLLSSNDPNVIKAILKQLNEYEDDDIIKGDFYEVKRTFEELDNFLVNYLQKTRKRFLQSFKLNLLSRTKH